MIFKALHIEGSNIFIIQILIISYYKLYQDQGLVWILWYSYMWFRYLIGIYLLSAKGLSPNFASDVKQNVSELIHFYFPWNHQKTIVSLMILGEIEVNWFA